MERHEVLAALKSLRLYGMAAVLEEAVATGTKRNRSPWDMLAELVTAEGVERKVRSIRYQMAAANSCFELSQNGAKLRPTAGLQRR